MLMFDIADLCREWRSPFQALEYRCQVSESFSQLSSLWTGVREQRFCRKGGITCVSDLANFFVEKGELLLTLNDAVLKLMDRLPLWGGHLMILDHP